jgi:hypothetical protein
MPGGQQKQPALTMAEHRQRLQRMKDGHALFDFCLSSGGAILGGGPTRRAIATRLREYARDFGSRFTRSPTTLLDVLRHSRRKGPDKSVGKG